MLPLPHFDVNQRPLPAATQEVLNARQQQEFVGGVFTDHSDAPGDVLQSRSDDDNRSILARR